MGILFYQIGIFIAIQVASAFGKNSRNVAIVLISIFTIIQVFTTQLIIIQFVTIFISYFISKSIFFSEEKVAEKQTTAFTSSQSDKIQISNYGIVENNPVLMNSIPSSYAFLEKLASIKEGIEFKRKGSIVVNGYPRPIDFYDFSISGNKMCTIYVYAYHNSNIDRTPLPFLHLSN